MTRETQKLVFEDGASVELVLRRGHSKAPLVVFTPGLGMGASYYEGLLDALAETGLNVASWDLRGIGSSSIRARRGVDFGYRELLEIDMPAVVEAARAACPKGPLFLMGHSLGGHLSYLFASASGVEVAGVMAVACSSVYHRAWGFPKGVGIWVYATGARWIARAMGVFPGRKLGFGDREAPRLIWDWSQQGKTGRFEPKGSAIDYEHALGLLTAPCLMVSFTDDTFSPLPCVEHLLAKMPRADQTHERLDPKTFGTRVLGHFAWARQPDHIVPVLTAWLLSQTHHH